MKRLIALPTPEPEPLAVQIAKSEIERLNAEFIRRVDIHKASFTRFWDGPVTPDEIIEGCRTAREQADLAYIALAGESYRHLATMASSLGQDINDFIPAEYYEPRRAISVVDGQIVLAPPAEGYDAHGRLIPPPIDPSDLPPGFIIPPVTP